MTKLSKKDQKKLEDACRISEELIEALGGLIAVDNSLLSILAQDLRASFERVNGQLLFIKSQTTPSGD